MSGDETVIGSEPVSIELVESSLTNSSMINVDIGGRLKRIREAHGFSQRELAKRAGITNSNISMIEQGQVSPSVQSLTRILAAFPMSLAQFFGSGLAVDGKFVYAAEELVAEQVLATSGLITRRLPGATMSRQLDLQLQIIPSGFVSDFNFPLHSVDYSGFVIDGNLQLIVGTKLHELSAGDGFYVPGTMAYRIRNLSVKTARIMACSLFVQTV